LVISAPRGSLLNVIWVNHAAGGAVIKIYSFHITKCPRMIVVVLPVSGNNYFILKGGYSGEMTPSMDAGSGPVCLTSRKKF
jgi:hypothetical protein